MMFAVIGPNTTLLLFVAASVIVGLTIIHGQK